jgi:putative restriction endonuclease
MEYELPALTSLVVSKSKGIPGEGFIGAPIDDWDNEINRVFREKWEANPFGSRDDGDFDVEKYSDLLFKYPEKSGDVYRKVKDRGLLQKIFRNSVMRAYGGSCAVCDFYLATLQAAHIYPYRKACVADKINVCNGILLCPNHHALYDNGILTISEDYIIGCDEEIEYNDDVDQDIILKYVGRKIRLPKNKKLWPDKKLLKIHCSDEDC